MARPVWGQPVISHPLNVILPAIRGVLARYDIEECSLAGSVGAHQSHNFALPDVETYIPEGNQAAEALGYSILLKGLVLPWYRCQMPMSNSRLSEQYVLSVMCGSV